MRYRKYAVFYVLTFIFAFGMKYYCREAGSEELIWLLAPTAWWLKCISGMAFSYEPGIGYVSHALRFIIAPSCAGSQFMIICMVTLVVSFVHRMGTWKRGFAWTGFSLGASYFLTILVNGTRIILSVRIPQMLEEKFFYENWISSKQLHTLIGTATYFMSLLVIFCLADRLSGHAAEIKGTDAIKRYVQPVFWYALFVIGIPFLNRMNRNDYEGFAEYACLIMGACLVSTGILWTGFALKELRRRKN